MHVDIQLQVILVQETLTAEASNCAKQRMGPKLQRGRPYADQIGAHLVIASLAVATTASAATATTIATATAEPGKQLTQEHTVGLSEQAACHGTCDQPRLLQLHWNASRLCTSSCCLQLGVQR